MSTIYILHIFEGNIANMINNTNNNLNSSNSNVNPNTVNMINNLIKTVNNLPIVGRWSFYVLSAMVIIIFGVYGSYNQSEFIYFQF